MIKKAEAPPTLRFGGQSKAKEKKGIKEELYNKSKNIFKLSLAIL